MGLLAEFELNSPAMLLGPTLEALPAVRFDLERQYAMDPERPIGFLSVASTDRETVEAAFAADETVRSFEQLERTENGLRYRLKRSSDVVAGYETWVPLGGELLRCQSDGRCWERCMRFPDRDAFATYHERLTEAGVGFTLRRLGDTVTETTETATLTPAQATALEVAYETGYFNIPREATLEDVAQTIGISDQAVSERLRRGQARLVAHYFSE